MNQEINTMALLRGKIGTIILAGLFVASLSFLFLIINEKNFKVSTSYLVVQNQGNSQDFYTLTKSSEYIGKVLSEGVYSELFINEIVKTGKVKQEFLPFDKKSKIEEWSKIVKVNRNAELGMIDIVVFNNNQSDALSIAQGISDVLMTKSNLFLGEGQNIQIKILSGPVLEKNPSITNMGFAILGGFIFGILLMFIRIYYKAVNDSKKIYFGTKNFSEVVYPIKNEIHNEYGASSVYSERQ